MAEARQHRFDAGVVEDAAVVALEEQRRTVLPEVVIQQLSHLSAGEFECGSRFELVAAGQARHADELEFAALLVGQILGGIGGPGDVGLQPSLPRC